MIYIALSSAVLIYFCFILLLSPLARKKERIKSRINHIDDMFDPNDRFRDEKFKQPLAQRFLKPVFLKVIGRLSNIFPKLNSKKSKILLEKAGYEVQPATYNVIQVFVILASGALFMAASLMIRLNIVGIILFSIFGMLLGMLILRYTLLVKIRRRKELMSRQMPEVLDLLSVSVEAGLGFDAALLHVVNRLEGPLIDELLVSHREISLGKPRSSALAALGERTGIDAMLAFTSAVIQAERRGLSLKNVLNIQAAQIRQQRRQLIQERAMKAPVKIILPLVFFIFPVILIVLLGPAIMTILNLLGGV